MSERKVLTKYYPPDFDPSKITRSRLKKDPSSSASSKLATVRLMAPFSMKCLSCGEFIYKGRKFNARKETTDEKYLAIAIYRFYIRCTRCSAEITFKTDPKRMDYVAERGAKRNFEMWRQQDPDGDANANGGGDNHLETEEEMLDRLESEAALANGGAGAMADLEAKVHDARTEMAIADALDEIRVRNARIQRAEGREGGQDEAVRVAEAKRRREEEERIRVEREDEEAARRAFARGRGHGDDDDDGGGEIDGPGDDTGDGDRGDEEGKRTMMPPPLPPPPSLPAPPAFKKTVKKKKDFSSALGIVRKKQPSLV